MRLSGLMMIGFSNNPSLIHNHRTHHGIGACFPYPPSRQGKGTFHVKAIRWDGGHRRFEEVEDFLRSVAFATDFFFAAVFLANVFLVVVFFLLVFFLDTAFVDLIVVARFFPVNVLLER
jgi:hypothetical protein